MNIKEVQDRIIENMKKGGDLVTDDGKSIESWHEKSSQFLHIRIRNGGRQEQICISESWVRSTIAQLFIKPRKSALNFWKMMSVFGISEFIEKYNI